MKGEDGVSLTNITPGLKFAPFKTQALKIGAGVSVPISDDKEFDVRLGGGIEFGLPTGDDSKGIGSDHTLVVEPFLDCGYQLGHLETVGFLSFGIPTNTNSDDEADVELGWNLSLLYHVSARIEVLLEFDGERVFGGEEGFGRDLHGLGLEFCVSGCAW